MKNPHVAIVATLAFPNLAHMLHRHLNHQRFTLAAIDDDISRGQWQDWADLRIAVLYDAEIAQKVASVCRVCELKIGS